MSLSPLSTYQPCTHLHHQARGFTLIELMVAVAIVAILATLSYPSYREHVARSQRAQAKAALLETAQWLERQYTVYNSYLDYPNPDSTKPNLTITIPDTLKYVPSGSDNSSATYIVSFDVTPSGTPLQTTSSYSLIAKPQTTMANDKCGKLILNSLGEKEIKAPGTGGPTAKECWDR